MSKEIQQGYLRLG